MNQILQTRVAKPNLFIVKADLRCSFRFAICGPFALTQITRIKFLWFGALSTNKKATTQACEDDSHKNPRQRGSIYEPTLDAAEITSNEFFTLRYF